jgi:hypothetical protein
VAPERLSHLQRCIPTWLAAKEQGTSSRKSAASSEDYNLLIVSRPFPTNGRFGTLYAACSITIGADNHVLALM